MNRSAGAIVLAAGRSSRMGSPKALLPYRGRPFLTHLVENLIAAGLDPVVVVGPPDPAPLAEALPTAWGVRLVGNPDRDRGQISSLRRGLEAVGPACEAVLSCPVDHALVAAATCAALVEAAFEAASAIAIPVHAGRRGHPTLFARTVFQELATCPDEGGARNVVGRDPGRVLLVEVDDPAVLLDADTPEEYRRLD